ncbi:hypothetical protein CPJCM30710_26150 [Clostridium polyendosporum]|uniref:non-specific serine/threonine protein kinase n=1 Tax=Clostridium polyendosporum TaxID=69208 RepID=A0A919S153_9CLOT|nr:serine/threonine-protein kinase [Clostridium polyendosporum]GIM29949.1 hypothetical protein CPJCM30710_26150 [Clostridium polyendosporum]
MLDKGYVLDEKYEVIEVLGRGGMGTVYLCKNIRLENLWAVKEITKDSQINVDFLSEPNILKNLNHPGIPRIVDIFYENNNLYMVQDYIRGQTLKECVKQSKIIEKERIYNITSSLCDIIAYLHRLAPPIIYRDLKPANIIITPDKKVVLIDFGISRVYKEDRDDDTVYMGSNGYAAPEQYGSGQSCKQTDIYGIGMVMYHMATGKVASTHLEPLVDDNYNNVDDNLKKVIQKCVQLDIKDRYTSAEELKNEIIHLMKESIYEKTVFLNNPSQNLNATTQYSSTKYMAAEHIATEYMSTEHVNVKKNSKLKLKRSVVGLLVLAIIILTVVYLSYRSGENKNSDVTNNLPVSNSSESVPVSEQKSVDKDKEDKTGEVSNSSNNESTKSNIPEQSNINKDSSSKTSVIPQKNSKNDEKKDDQSKDKGKSEGKKKSSKNKHDDD